MAQLVEEEYFFNLPYWSSLLIRHNLDVMHIEKNICEALLGTLLEIAGKTKDTEKARLDLQVLTTKIGTGRTDRSDRCLGAV